MMIITHILIFAIFIIPILQGSQMRPRKAVCLAQGHRTTLWGEPSIPSLHRRGMREGGGDRARLLRKWSTSTGEIHCRCLSALIKWWQHFSRNIDLASVTGTDLKWQGSELRNPLQKLERWPMREVVKRGLGQLQRDETKETNTSDMTEETVTKSVTWWV